MINFITAGESHGKGVVVILEGVPAGLKISIEEIKSELLRRKKGYGRGDRQSFEQDEIEIISGIRYNETIGSPICVMVHNKDYREPEFWGNIKTNPLQSPRPGHADLTGALKFLRSDLKDISERSSARETVARVVAGSFCKRLLSELEIFVGSFVTSIHKIDTGIDFLTTDTKKLLNLHNIAEKSDLRFPDITKEKKIKAIIDETKNKKDTLGGNFVVFSVNNPVGLGSHTQWNQRLNAKIAFYLMSIPAVKSVEIGLGRKYSENFGSEVHDEIFYSSRRFSPSDLETHKGLKGRLQWASASENPFFHRTNNAGGIEGGISNGEPIIVQCTMKPIPTLLKPLKTVNIKTKKPSTADIIRSDVLAVPSCSVVAESMLAICLANEIKLKFGSDSVKELVQNYKNYKNLTLKI